MPVHVLDRFDVLQRLHLREFARMGIPWFAAVVAPGRHGYEPGEGASHPLAGVDING
jgi:hypothetical protein